MPRNKNFSLDTPFIFLHCSSIFNVFIKDINALSHKIYLSEYQPIEPSHHKTPFQLFRAIRDKYTRTFVGIPLYFFHYFACFVVCLFFFIIYVS